MNSIIGRIHEKYFELLNDYLGSIYRRSPSREPHEAGVHYSNLYLSGKIIHNILPDLKESIMTLWKRNKTNLYSSISNIPGLKARYSGDISPSQCSDLVARTGLYIDTTLIPDPLLKLLALPLETMRERHLVYYIVKHAFNILNARDLFFSETEAPISVIFPLDLYFNERRSESCTREAVLDIKGYFEELLDRRFDKEKQLDSVLDQETEILASEIKRPQNLVPGFHAQESSKGLLKCKKEIQDTGFIVTEGKSPGWCLKHYVFGSLMGLSDCFIDCISFDAKPLFNVPNSWFMFKWKLKRGSSQAGQGLGVDVSTAVANALQLDDFRWLGNVPLEKLVLIRNNYELQDLRELLNREVSEIYECNRDELETVARRVRYNLTKEFRKHEREIKDIDNKFRKRYKIDTSLLVAGTIVSVAGLFWPPAALASLVGGSGLVDLMRVYSEHEKQILEISSKPIGILFEAYQKEEHL